MLDQDRLGQHGNDPDLRLFGCTGCASTMLRAELLSEDGNIQCLFQFYQNRKLGEHGSDL